MCGVYDNSLLIQYLIQPEQYLSNPFSNKSEELIPVFKMLSAPPSHICSEILRLLKTLHKHGSMPVVFLLCDKSSFLKPYVAIESICQLLENFSRIVNDRRERHHLHT